MLLREEHMNYCPHCGAKRENGAKFCPGCGAKLDGGDETNQKAYQSNQEAGYQAEPVQNTAYPNNSYQNSTNQNNAYQAAPNQYAPYQAAPKADDGGPGWKVLSFFFPLVGLILFLVWNNEHPQKAKACGKWALIGFLTGIVLSVLAYCASFSLVMGSLGGYY